MKNTIIITCFAVLAYVSFRSIAVQAAPPGLTTVSVTSSSTGTLVMTGFPEGANINSGGAVCLARTDDCTLLTSCIGLPLAADTAVSLNYKNDSNKQWCAILKSGSTPVTLGVNRW